MNLERRKIVKEGKGVWRTFLSYVCRIQWVKMN